MLAAIVMIAAAGLVLWLAFAAMLGVVDALVGEGGIAVLTLLMFAGTTWLAVLTIGIAIGMIGEAIGGAG